MASKNAFLFSSGGVLAIVYAAGSFEKYGVAYAFRKYGLSCPVSAAIAEKAAEAAVAAHLSRSRAEMKRLIFYAAGARKIIVARRLRPRQFSPSKAGACRHLRLSACVNAKETRRAASML